MNRPRIILIGASGHGRVALDAALCQDRFEVVGWADSNIPEGTQIADRPVLGRTADIARMTREHNLQGFFLAISDNVTRATVHAMIRASVPDLDFVSIVHPSAVVASNATVGPGSLLLAGAVLNSFANIGIGCIVNTRASLDHDGVMHPWSSLLPGVVTGGNTEIGEFSCVCIGAILAHKVRIGENSVVGAGAVVLSDLPPCTLAYGVPARVIRTRKPGERHF